MTRVEKLEAMLEDLIRCNKITPAQRKRARRLLDDE